MIKRIYPSKIVTRNDNTLKKMMEVATKNYKIFKQGDDSKLRSIDQLETKDVGFIKVPTQ
jgi:hypothetical protein